MMDLVNPIGQIAGVLLMSMFELYFADILAEFVCPDAKCLEMFARNLTTGWTSWGNEVQITIKCIRFTLNSHNYEQSLFFPTGSQISAH